MGRGARRRSQPAAVPPRCLRGLPSDPPAGSACAGDPTWAGVCRRAGRARARALALLWSGLRHGARVGGAYCREDSCSRAASAAMLRRSSASARSSLVACATSSGSSRARTRACRRGTSALSRCRAASACDAARQHAQAREASGTRLAPALHGVRACVLRACVLRACVRACVPGSARLGLGGGEGGERDPALLVPEAEQQLPAVQRQRGAVTEHPLHALLEHADVLPLPRRALPRRRGVARSAEAPLGTARLSGAAADRGRRRRHTLAQLVDGMQQLLAMTQHLHAQLEQAQLVQQQQLPPADAVRLVVEGEDARAGARASGWSGPVFKMSRRAKQSSPRTPRCTARAQHCTVTTTTPR